MEILEDQEKGLLSRLPEYQPLHGVKCLLAPLAWIEFTPRRVVHGHVEQRQQRWECRLQRTVEREELPRYLLSDLAHVVAVLDLEVTLEEIDHRQVARRLAVRDRGAVEDQPILEPMGVRKLVDETRLAHPSFAHHRRHLTMAGGGELLGPAQLLQFGVAPNELGEAAAGGRLEAGPHRPRSCHFVDLDRSC